MSKSAKSTQFPWLNTPLGPLKSPDSVGFSPLGPSTSARRARPVPGPCLVAHAVSLRLAPQNSFRSHWIYHFLCIFSVYNVVNPKKPPVSEGLYHPFLVNFRMVYKFASHMIFGWMFIVHHPEKF